VTREQIQTLGDKFRGLKDTFSILSNLVVIGTVACGFVIWMSGGIKPQTQVAAEDLARQVTRLQADVEQIKDKLGIIPRPDDYKGQEAHLSRIDGALQSFSERITTDEISSARTAERLDNYINERTQGKRN